MKNFLKWSKQLQIFLKGKIFNVRRLLDLDDIIDLKKFSYDVKDSEWQIISSDELNEETLAQKKH